LDYISNHSDIWYVSVGHLYLYHLAASNFKNVTSIRNKNCKTPKLFKLYDNYPNPFNPTTVIRYSIVNMNIVKISVYNAIGQKISTLVNKRQPAGSYSVNFNGSNLAAGIYYYQITVGNFQQTKQMLLLK